MSVGLLLLRVVVGVVMTGHGLQKLFGLFGGTGLSGARQMVENLKLYPVREQALAAALSETVGGLLTGLGLLSPLGPAMVIGTMVIAIKTVHFKNGFWSGKGGYEYNLTLIGASLGLAFAGPGRWSLDQAFAIQHTGNGWGGNAVGIGLVAALLTLAVAKLARPRSVGSSGES